MKIYQIICYYDGRTETRIGEKDYFKYLDFSYRAYKLTNSGYSKQQKSNTITFYY